MIDCDIDVIECCFVRFCFFFFKQKTAYEMRMRDWSSDVCSSDLGAAKPLDISITRETIRVQSVRSRLLEPGYGYIRIAAFQADTAAEFSRKLDALQKQAGKGDDGAGGLRGLVLDVRSNPGGLLVSAVQIADDLLDKGGIVSTRGRLALSRSKFDATPGDKIGRAHV